MPNVERDDRWWAWRTLAVYHTPWAQRVLADAREAGIVPEGVEDVENAPPPSDYRGAVGALEELREFASVPFDTADDEDWLVSARHIQRVIDRALGGR